VLKQGGAVTWLAALLLVWGCVLVAVQEAPRRSIADGIFSHAQAQRGKVQYYARCAICHGQDLKGDIESPALTGRRFDADWVGKTVGERFQRIRATMPLEFPSTLDERTTLDILAFIFEFNGYPSGEQDLPGDIAVLAKVVIERSR
jgi:cytochrome c